MARGRTDGQTDVARSTSASDPDQEYIYFMLVILIKNKYTLCGRKRFLLPVTYFSTNLEYPSTLRVPGIVNAKYCKISKKIVFIQDFPIAKISSTSPCKVTSK